MPSSLVLVIQSALWFQLVRRLRWEVNSSPQTIVHKAMMPWTRGTALDHWSLPTVYLAIEGKHQHKIVLYDDAVVQTPQPDNLARTFIRLARDLVRIMDERTKDGYVFRIDLRLRPDPGATPVAM